MEKSLAVVILAAGKGKRMNNPELPKVLAELNGKPLIQYVLNQIEQFYPEKVVTIVGHHKEHVIEFIENLGLLNHTFAEQIEQHGTGHAVMQAKNELSEFDGDVLILCGDVPLLQYSTLNHFISIHQETNSDLSVLTAVTSNPFGYGRIVRNSNNDFEKIVEEKDANDSEKAVNEVNSGIYLVDCKKLFYALSKIQNTNAQDEYYLTDIVSILKSEDNKINAYSLVSFDEMQGINSQDDLLRAAKYFDFINQK